MICALIVPDRDAIDHVGMATHLFATPELVPQLHHRVLACPSAGLEFVLSLLRTSGSAALCFARDHH